MASIIDALRNKPFLYTQRGADENAISSAESLLGTYFADDYREYLRAFGVVTYQGHELTGISDVVRLSVVNSTLQGRSSHAKECQSWYVIENAAIDCITIWQSPNGVVYQASPNQVPVQIASSLEEYVIRF